MADPADAATAAANDEDVYDLYADLDEQVAAALAAAGESGGSNTKDSDPATDAEADANEAVDLGDGLPAYSSSDEESEDDIRIVLNEDGCAPPPPSAGRCEEGWAEESEEGDVRGRGSLLKSPYVNDGGRGKLSGLHYKGHLDQATVPITGQGDRGHQNAFQKDYYFFLPRNRTVFDINTEVFQHKAWRQHGVDLTDYFNFGLNEEGWRKYCFGIKQFRQGARSLAIADELSGLDQETHYNLESNELMPKSATLSGFEGTQGSDDLAKPKGRAIDVEGGVFERLPSADMWRPRQRDSDVVIQVNLMLSPSNQSTSDDSSTVNGKCKTNERISINKPGVKCLKDTSLVVDRIADREVHNGGSSDYTRSKLDMRDLAYTRDHSSSPDYFDMLSEELTEDCYFKRANRHSNSKSLYADTKLKNVHAKSDFCHHSSKSDQESSKSDGYSYIPSSADDRYHNKTKLPRMDEPDFISSEVFVNRRSDHRLLKSGHKGIKEQKRHSSAGARQNVFKKQEKITDSYRSRYDRKHDRCYAVHDQVYEKHDYSPLERASLRNDVHCFSNNPNHQRRHSWHKFNDDEDGVHCFSSAKGWQERRDHTEIGGRIYRESYYQEMRRVRHGRSEDDEFFHYTDYRFGKLQGPEVRGKYRNRRSAESNNENLRHPYHLVLSPEANDYPTNSQRDWPSPGLTSLRSKNRCIDNKRIQNLKETQYHPDGYYQNNKHHGLSFRIGNMQQSALYSAADETGYCILPVKRRLHSDLGSMNRKDLVNLSFPKVRRLMHDQSIISGRKLYAAETHSSPTEFGTEAICSFSDMRNSNTTKNHDERRHERVDFQAKDMDSSHLNDRKRKRKFKQQGNEIRHEVESDNEECLPPVKNLRYSRHKDVHQKARKLNRSYHHSVNQDFEKSTNPSHKNVVSTNEEDEIEEGELIEQDHQDTVSKRKLNKQIDAALKSVIEVSAAGQLEVINAASKDDVCDAGATKEFDDKHILQVMEKMQKRRERFKEPVITEKEEDNVNEELSTVACSKDGIKNQRPARRRRWGGSG